MHIMDPSGKMFKNILITELPQIGGGGRLRKDRRVDKKIIKKVNYNLFIKSSFIIFLSVRGKREGTVKKRETKYELFYF